VLLVPADAEVLVLAGAQHLHDHARPSGIARRVAVNDDDVARLCLDRALHLHRCTSCRTDTGTFAAAPLGRIGESAVRRSENYGPYPRPGATPRARRFDQRYAFGGRDVDAELWRAPKPAVRSS
jgi:hypothetical protein